MYSDSSENSPHSPWFFARTRNLMAIPGVRCGAWNAFFVMVVNLPTCAQCSESYLAVPLDQSSYCVGAAPENLGSFHARLHARSCTLTAYGFIGAGGGLGSAHALMSTSFTF